MRSNGTWLTARVLIVTGFLAAAAFNVMTPAHANSTVTGLGLDTCAAPSDTQMDSLRTSYSFIGIYTGGFTRSCSQTNLDGKPAWINSQLSHKWSFIAIWDGYQNPCYKESDASHEFSTAAATAIAQGEQAASNAVSTDDALGFGPSGIITADIEAYTGAASNNKYSVATCEAASQDYIAGWTDELHADGYKSSIYGSSAGSELANTASSPSPEDYVFFAEVGSANTSSSYIPTGDWSHTQRVKQFSINDASSLTPGGTLDKDCADSVLDGTTNSSGAC